MLSLAGVIAVAAQQQFGSGLGILFALLAGAAVGLANGLLVTHLRINAFIGTLGVMTVLRGVALLLSRSHTLPGQDPVFAALADWPIFGIPASAILAAVLFLATLYLMSTTPIGRSIYAVGGSLEASRLAGLRVERSLLLAYLSCGVAAATAGVVVSSQINSGSPLLGNDTPLYAIAAVLLGGISMRGGAGSLIGMLQGVLILGILTQRPQHLGRGRLLPDHCRRQPPDIDCRARSSCRAEGPLDGMRRRIGLSFRPGKDCALQRCLKGEVAK